MPGAGELRNFNTADDWERFPLDCLSYSIRYRDIHRDMISLWGFAWKRYYRVSYQPSAQDIAYTACNNQTPQNNQLREIIY